MKGFFIRLRRGMWRKMSTIRFDSCCYEHKTRKVFERGSIRNQIDTPGMFCVGQLGGRRGKCKLLIPFVQLRYLLRFRHPVH